ncbi:flagellar basal-body rod protein FlgF [Bartonella ancashensis]|uniref:Flagellar basal-body rod protein FlgF n=1 Tax=Bartonella ancashensis TaxID=1318743 RepID=A0A0M4LRR9_9HYPH|nr:flagellar basal-body rod protein FlgF [Bartonella ancashensis]ALE02972.1 Flagellar basal-body rod protein FlgF [Bartonella ancashensis]
MQNPIYVSVSGQISLARRMETIAQNMANVNTPGFRAGGVKFDMLISPTAQEQGDHVLFASAGKGYISTENGAFVQTGNALDIAVSGDSYLSMQASFGQVYTRDGRMVMTEDGVLVSVTGLPFLDDGGAPIQLNPVGGIPRIGEDGSIYQNNVLIGRIGLFQFQQGTQLNYGPNSSVIPDREVMQVDGEIGSGVMQGYIENSNVNGVVEMTRLIEVSRAFERLESMLRQQEEMRSKSIQILGGQV